jgi:hypothetical protein
MSDFSGGHVRQVPIWMPKNSSKYVTADTLVISCLHKGVMAPEVSGA